MISEQYESILNEILREYAEERFRNREERRRRQEEVYAKIPAFRELSKESPRRSLEKLYRVLEKEDGTPLSMEDVRAEERTLSEKKRLLLTQNGFPADYLSPIHTCPDCEDTGFQKDEYGARTLRCGCFTKKLAERLCERSGLGEQIRDADFSKISLQFYEGEALEQYKKTYEACREFVSNPEHPYKNFFFYGTIGTGKSFLSCCVAKELIAQGREVLYFSAGMLFDRLAQEGGVSRKDSGAGFLRSSLYDCDLLILDDLGTEWFNSFVFSEIFKLVNERILRQRSTIISTNLTLQNLTEVYSERLLSRITSNYRMCKFSGPDIRMEKRRRQGKAE